jgi:phosphatidate cytidylyltransferase
MFLALALIAMLIAGWEWTQLAEIQPLTGKILYLVLLAAALLSSIFVPIYFIIIFAILWWILAFILLLIYPTGINWWGYGNLIRAMMGFFVLIPFWVGLIILQGFSPTLLLFSLILIWGVDSAAYFIGRKWGKHKLAPTISPGKSYEGLIAGLITAFIIAILGFWILGVPSERWLLFIAICLFGGLLTVLGDLFESMLKRQAKVKDSSSLLPGHGGILDRIDSMVTAIPFFALVFPYFFQG